MIYFQLHRIKNVLQLRLIIVDFFLHKPKCRFEDLFNDHLSVWEQYIQLN